MHPALRFPRLVSLAPGSVLRSPLLISPALVSASLVCLSLLVTLVFLASPVGGQSGAPELPTLAVVVLEAGLEVTGATPGGEVAVLSVWREQGTGGSEVTVLDDTLVDEDGDGAVTLELERTVPPLSVWVVVDVASGEGAVVTPEAFEAEPRQVRPGSFRATDELAELAVPRAEVLVVRPGTDAEAGAFRARLGDGGEGDRDGAVDGRVALSALEIERPARRPVGRAEPPVPARFRGGDRVIAVDPRTLVVTEVTVPGAAEGGQP